MDNIELFFPEVNETFSEILTALLSSEGYESFWNDDDGLRAYIASSDFDEKVVEKVLASFGSEKINYTYCATKPGSWVRGNDDFFEPTIVSERLRIRRSTDFVHDDYPIEIVIDPNLAFGSGNHPSTLLCIEMMLEIEIVGKAVADIGTGTGILSILAEKLGALGIVAFDNNPWAVQVAVENLAMNSCTLVKVETGSINDYISILMECGVVLANLNMDVFRHEYHRIAKTVTAGAKLIVSGIMVKDQEELYRYFHATGLTFINCKIKDGWVAMLFTRC